MDRKLKLEVAYDGSRFSGWQRQSSARSVQETLEEALKKLTGKRTRVIGAGRTDSGVHAQQQVAHVTLSEKLPPRILLRALNAILPEDVAVLSVKKAPLDFHAIASAKKKHYRYTIWNKPIRPVFDRDNLLHVPGKLNLTAMRKTAQLLKGKHDFRAFHSSGRPISSTVRTLSTLTVRSKNGLIRIDAQADGFLYHMVRRIVGLLLETGRGKLPASSARDLLKGNSRFIAPTAPAKGLCLIKVFYS